MEKREHEEKEEDLVEKEKEERFDDAQKKQSEEGEWKCDQCGLVNESSKDTCIICGNVNSARQ